MSDTIKTTFLREAMMAVLKSYPAGQYTEQGTPEETGKQIADVAYYAAEKAWQMFISRPADE